MALVVGTYECEWNKAVNDPETVKRFRHFINSERPDPAVVHVPERGQRRPATPVERQRETESTP
jgi:nitrite reductase (NADH) large subunit